jgi:hypothetical protein
LFFSIIGDKYTILEAKERSNLDIEKIAELISTPDSENFFGKENEDGLKIYCKYDWISKNILERVSLRNKEMDELANVIEEKLAKHILKYWSEDNIVKRDLEARTVGEWIDNEISFLAGFALWFREKEKDGELDLSNLISDAVGENISASGEIEFDTKRFEIFKSLTSNALTALKNISPAGKIAYRSMDIAVIKGISEGDNKYATKMKERTLPYQKPWWKFW